MDDHGSSSVYFAAPLTSVEGTFYTLRLSKWNPQVNSYTRYVIRLEIDGTMSCTCPGFQSHKHCKHIDASRVAGLIPADHLLAVRGQSLTLQNSIDEWQRRLEHLKAQEAALAEREAEARRQLENLASAKPARRPKQPRQVRKPRLARNTQPDPQPLAVA